MNNIKVTVSPKNINIDSNIDVLKSSGDILFGVLTKSAMDLYNSLKKAGSNYGANIDIVYTKLNGIILSAVKPTKKVLDGNTFTIEKNQSTEDVSVVISYEFEIGENGELSESALEKFLEMYQKMYDTAVGDVVTNYVGIVLDIRAYRQSIRDTINSVATETGKNLSDVYKVAQGKLKGNSQTADIISKEFNLGGFSLDAIKRFYKHRKADKPYRFFMPSKDITSGNFDKFQDVMNTQCNYNLKLEF